jgi:regulator of sigma E protease
MDVLSILGLPLATFIFYLAAFLVALMVIVFIHEYGHFQVARWCGVKIEAFSIGFGRELFGWNDRYGTRWKLSWLPLGGYVKFEGDANAASLPGEVSEETRRQPGNFHGKPVWQRALVVAAGPAANFLLAILVFTAAYSVIGVPVIEPRVKSVLEGSAAERAGILPGDLILTVDGKAIDSFFELKDSVVARAGEDVLLTVDRGGQVVTIHAVPDLKEQSDGFGGKVRIGLLGVSPETSAVQTYRRYGVIESLQKGTGQTWHIVATTMKYVGKLIVGRETADQIGGPISMAKAAGDAASAGPSAFVVIIAILSVSIGLINLFPIPMLDGGHLVYYAIEAVRGKPLGPEAQEWGFRIGFSLVIMLMLFGFFNDGSRILNGFFAGS